VTLAARAAATAGPLAGSFRRNAPGAGREMCTEESEGIAVRWQGQLTNLDELAARLGRPDLRDDVGALLAALYRRGGPGFVAELRGAFALALHDVDRHRLLLARDRLGREPLFYAEAGSEIVYSSRLEAIAARSDVRLEIDVEAVNLYLGLQFFPHDRTAFRAIRKLPPAHLLEVSANGVRRAAYWQAPFGGDDHPLVRALGEALESRLVSVYRDLPAGEGSFGVFASGGVDSSTNLVFLARCGRPAVALTAAFDDADYDESADARRVVASQGFPHRVARVGEEHLELLPALAAGLNEPIADQAALPTRVLLQAAVGDLGDLSGVGSIVSGEGGDELFGPPRRFAWSDRLGAPPGDRWALALEYAELIACCPSGLRRELLVGAGSGRAISEGPAHLLHQIYQGSEAGSTFQLLKLGQLATWLPENVLAKDRDLAAGVGLRPSFPLIDDDLVELIAGLPPAQHLAGCSDKQLLRETIAPALPAGALEKPKHRFLVPVARWRTPVFLAGAREALISPSSRTRDLYDRAALERLLTGYTLGQAGCDRPLWALLVLEHWLRHIESRRGEGDGGGGRGQWMA
jgi:asparagine synthase (glutamine-hydrolysing)